MILDTNVLSALMSVPPVAAVIQWMDEQAADRLFITAITVAEVRYGLGIMPEGLRRTDLIMQADAMFGQDFRGRILSFDERAANAFGALSSHRRALGRPISISDGLHRSHRDAPRHADRDPQCEGLRGAWAGADQSVRDRVARSSWMAF